MKTYNSLMQIASSGIINARKNKDVLTLQLMQVIKSEVSRHGAQADMAIYNICAGNRELRRFSTADKALCDKLDEELKIIESSFLPILVARSI